MTTTPVSRSLRATTVDKKPSPQPQRADWTRRVGRAAVMVLTAAAVVAWLVRRHHGRPIDFLVYRAAAHAAGRGADLYTANDHVALFAHQPFTYTPFASLTLLPTTWGDPFIAYVTHCVLLIVVLAWIVLRLLPATVPHRLPVAVVCVVLLSTTAVVDHNVQMGQVNILLMGLVMADHFRRDDTPLGRVLPPGVLVGLAAGIKLTPIVFAAYFVVSRQWRAAVAAGAAATATLVIGALLRPGSTVTWLHTAVWSLTDRVNTAGSLASPRNNSITGALHALGPVPGRLAPVVVASLAVAMLITARWLHRRGGRLEAWLVVGLITPLVSPLSWIHHLVYVVPALVVICFGGSATRLPTARRLLCLAPVLVLLHADPSRGQAWMTGGNGWLFLPGVIARESVVLVSLGCAIALVVMVRARTGRTSNNTIEQNVVRRIDHAPPKR